MRKRFRWGDVQAAVEKLSAPKIEKLYRHCAKLMARMPEDAQLTRLQIHAYTYFRMYGLAFKLEFDVAAAEWVLNFARDPRRPTRRPLPALLRRARRYLKAPKRARRARRRRKTSLKRIACSCRVWCGRSLIIARGKISPLLARTVAMMRAIGEAVLQDYRVRTRAAFSLTPWTCDQVQAVCDTGARLELRLFGESLGLPLWLNTFAPAPPLSSWDAALFGKRREESERMLA